MTLLIADTFTDSLGRLTGDEQKAVKTISGLERRYQIGYYRDVRHVDG